MDGSNWKKLLLYWINSSKLIDRSFYNIEQTDISEFYKKLRKKMVTFPYTEEDLLSFLKEQYPNVEFHTDDENQLSSSDYMYVYSLLLHFCCVKYSDEYFQKTCENLHNIYQESIAIFFKELLAVKILDKTILRNVISMATPSNLPKRMESPSRTSKPKVSPPTPKTFMLDERTKEMQKLKALLDNEKYEKTCLEMLLKQNEEKTCDLIKDQKKLGTEIKELKTELSVKNTEVSSSTSNISDEHQIKKQLRKQISDKDEELLNLKENYNLVTEEKKTLHQKLKYAEKQMAKCMENVIDCDSKLMDLKSEIQEKDIYIKQLTDSKNELIHFISEIRNSSNRGVDLNTSTECLDNSLSRTPNSSGSLGSPETLGCSVIDIQLREKENENKELRIEIEKFKFDNKSLSEHLCTLLKKHCESFEICNENLITNKDGDLTEIFMVFENYLEKLIQQYTIVNKNLNQYIEENNSLKSQISDLGKKIFGLGNQITDYDRKVDDLKKVKLITEQENQTYKSDCDSYKIKIEQLFAENTDLANQLNISNENCQTSINEKCQLNEELSAKISKLTENLTANCNKIEKMENLHKKLQNANTSLQQNVKELSKNNKNLEKLINNLKQEKNQINEEYIKVQHMLKQSQEIEVKLTNENLIFSKTKEEHLKIIDNLKCSITKFENNILSNEANIKNYENNLITRKNENIKLSLEVENLKTEMATLLQEKKEIKDKFDMLQSTFDLKIQEITKIEREIGEATAKNDKLYSEIELLSSKDLATENTLQTLKLEVVSLINEISENKKIISDLNNELETSNESFAHLKTDNNIELMELKNKVNNYLEIEKVLKKKNDDLNEQCGELRDNLKFSNRTTKDKSQEIDSLEKKLKNKIIECADLNQKIGNLTSHNGDMKKNIENMKSKLLESEENISILNQQIEEITAEKLKLNDEYTELKNCNVKCENQLKSFELEIKTLNNNIEEFESAKRKLSNDYEEISNIVEIFTIEKLSAQADLVNLQKEIVEKSDCLTKTQNIFDNELNKIIEEIENNVGNLIQTNIFKVNLELNTPLERLKNTINILLSGKSEMLQKNEEFEKIILNLKNDINIQSKENIEITEKLLITSNDNEALNTELFNLTEEINENIKNIQLVTDKCNVFQLEQFTLIDKLSAQQNELENIKSEKNCIILEKSSLNKKYEELMKEFELQKVAFDEKCADFDNNLQEKNTKITKSEDEKLQLISINNELTSKLKITNEKLNQYEEEKIESHNVCSNLKYTNNLTLGKYVSKEKECNLLSEEMRALAAHRFSLEENLLKTKKKLEEYEIFKEKYENLKEKHQSLKTSNEQILKELNITKNILEEERSKFKKDICEIRNESKPLEQQCTEFMNEIVLLKQNIINLTESLNKIEDEKVLFRDENRKLKEDLELEMIKTDVNQKKIKELLNNISSLEIKIKYLEENLETVVNEKDLEYLKLEKKYSNLNTEFNKLNECHLKAEENSQQLNKRFEVISIRLGEYQAKYSNLETENNSLKIYFESNKNTLDSLQKEYSKLILKHTNLQKEYTRIEKSEELNKLKLSEMDQDNQQLKIELDKILGAELTCRDDLQKLQIIKKDDDEKIKKLSTTLGELTHINQSMKQEMEYLEQKNVQLTLEIGSLNQMNKSIQDIKKITQTENVDITKNLIEIKNKNESLRDVIDQQEIELNQFREENSKLNDNISKLALNFDIVKEQNESNIFEVKNFKSQIIQLQNEKDNLLRDSFVSLELIKNLEFQHKTKDDQIEELKEMLDEKDKLIQQINNEINLVKTETINNNNDIKKKIEECDDLNKLYEEQKEKTEKLKRDTSIFQAKLTKQRAITEENEREWLEEKNRLIEINKTSEERIKNNRLELEGKLEKMKAKMKTLYNEEVAKMKNKHEREIFDFQAEIQVLRGQNDKYDMHVKKLSQRVLILNEKICEYERDNRFMELKLKEYESTKTTSLRRPLTQHQLSHSQHSQFPMNSQKLLSTANLRMEDEEGELFNNTYLTDLKEGRTSDFGMRDSISVKELQYRNSLAQPHLRSTYLAQYKEHNLPEEDIKDGIGPINLDDSLSSLLNTDKRKKVAGTTSYKRPGPPTPSKTAGRLSFGGNNEVHSTILRDTNENEVSTIRKTPVKFKLFSSRALKDEQPHHHIRRSSIKQKSLLMKPLCETFTSTPRKSKLHFDQRGQLDKLLNQSKSNSQTDTDSKKLNTRKNNIIISPAVLNHIDTEIPQKFTKWRNTKVIYSTESGTSDSNSPYVTDEPNQPKSSHKPKERRFSIINRRNIYGRSKLPSKILRDQIKSKAKSERYKNFNKCRQSLNEIRFRKSLLNQQNNNLKNIDCNIEQINIHHIFGNELTKTNLIFDDDFLQSDLKNFEKLLRYKESKAPFEVTDINLSRLSGNSGSNSTSIASNSKTLYASSVIFNRKIPQLSKTAVRRKSSIYIKNGNQTITLLDIIKMWNQMNNSVKLFFSFCISIFVILIIYILSLIWLS